MPPSGTQTDEVQARTIHIELMRDSVNLELDPQCCIPLYLARQRTDGGIRRLKASFQGKLHSPGPGSSGIVAGTDTPIVVQLEGDQLEHVVTFFISKGLQHSEALERSTQRSVWYGVIDGCHSIESIHTLMKEQPRKWAGFLWFVTVVKAGFPMDRYRQLARMQNERHNSAYFIQTTTYDLLKGLRDEHDLIYNERLKKSATGARGVNVKHQEVAHAYDGGEHSRVTFVRQAVTVAVRLSKRAITALGDVMNGEYPDMLLQKNDRRLQSLPNARTKEDILEHLDCRLFKNVVRFGALRAARNFINAVNDGKETEQVNSIYRLRHWSESRDYKPAQAQDVSTQYNIALDASHEDAKFLRTIRSDTWPEEMELCREKLHRTTVFDNEIIENRGNDNDVLPSIWSLFKRLNPARALALETCKQHPSDHNDNDRVNDSPTHDDGNNKSHESRTSDKSSDKELKRQRREQVFKENLVKEANMRSHSDSLLTKARCTSMCISWQDFYKQKWTSNSQRADLVIRDPGKAICLDEKKI